MCNSELPHPFGKFCVAFYVGFICFITGFLVATGLQYINYKIT